MNTFERTGMHLDLRVQVMRPSALKRFAEKFARCGFNTLLVEWEGAFPFVKHPLISNRYAYTQEEIRDFIALCERLGIEVIPLQQCFGHLEYILQHERYQHLRESHTDLCQLCPCKAQAALEVFESVFAEIIALHPSEYIHIGGDETYLLGNCPECRKVVSESGSSALYVGYIKQIAELVVRLGKRPLIWADMLLKYPDQAAQMPPSTVFVDWNYGWPVDRFGDPARLAEADFEFWGAPALRSNPDNHSIVSWVRHLDNFKNYIPYAQQSGFKGMILTSWSTSGVYGYRWEGFGLALELLPLRRVYPLGGCMLLLDAFTEALAANARGEAFEPADFVRNYAVKHFGLSPKEGERLWQAFQIEDKLLFLEADPAAAQPQAIKASAALAKLQPRRNAREFAHLQLVADLYSLRTRLRVLEKQTVDAGFTRRQVPAMLKTLEAMLAESKELDRRWLTLNRRDYYPDELKEECAYRNNRLTHLYLRLKRQR